MDLVMFDVDGTLTQTNRVDCECFVQAVEDVLGIKNIDTDWSSYKNVTDLGCLEEIIRKHKRRPGTKDELLRVKMMHIRLLKEWAESDPALFLPIPGAQDVINGIIEKSNAVAALATGGWLESIRIKLGTAGISIDGLTIASCNDAISRDEIMKIAETRAKDISGVPFRTRTYVGDAVWDVQASKRLSYFFIGIASGIREKGLKEEGDSNFTKRSKKKPQAIQIEKHPFVTKLWRRKLKKNLGWRLITTAVALGVCLYLILPLDKSFKKGLDLDGGTLFTIEVQTSNIPQDQLEETMNKALIIYRNRIDGIGVAGTTVERSAANRILVQVPGIETKDANRIRAILTRLAHLEFKIVLDGPGEPIPL